MSSLTLAALVQVSLLVSGDAASYTDAHRETIESGKPLLVMVSTEWCPPCQMMKKTIIPEVRRAGFLRKVAFAMVNPDVDRELAQQISGGGPVPQLVMFRKVGNGWVRNKLVGGQSVETVEKFITDAVEANSEEAHNPSAGNLPSAR